MSTAPEPSSSRLSANSTATTSIGPNADAIAIPEASETRIDPESEWQRWREARVRSLKAPQSWLTLTGLHFLADGAHTLGSDPSSDVRIDSPAFPARLGQIDVAGELIRFTPAASLDAKEASRVTLHDQPLGMANLRDDRNGKPSVFIAGPVTLTLVHRNGQAALRVRNDESPVRRRFESIDAFPYDPKFVVEAALRRAPPRSTIDITNVTGHVEQQPLAAVLSVTIQGSQFELSATPGSRPDSLFVVFSDATNGGDTYSGGRFLDVDAPTDQGSVVLDFNRAYNPPCAFTAFATCPMPPRSNRLPFPVKAGERHPPIMRPTE
ncbi:MAG: DUF1684 domain-containing protein [Phycisphaerae bacterium]|nr:DUF1684 domain-containing protein [Phycisphaerae bacterium]